MGHQELPALRGQDGLHSRCRNLHGLGQGLPLVPPWISWQCCPPSHGELAGHQQEPHAVHGPLLQLRHTLPPDRTWLVRIPVPGSSVCHRLEGLQAHPLPEQLPRPEESVHCNQVCRGQVRTVDRATACGGLHQVSKPPASFHTILHECSASGYSNFASRFRYMGAVDKNNQITHLNNTRRHYRWLRRLFMKFLVWAAYNAYIIMDSYRPHSRAGHNFRTFHMFVDELCLQLVGDYRRAVHRHEAQAQQSDLQGVGQHNPERSVWFVAPSTTST